MSEAALAAEAADTNEHDTEQSTAQSVEDKAQRMGWTPKDQFKGDPEKWVDAENFVKRGEELMPILKANNRKLERALEKAQGEIAEMKSTVAEFREFHSKTEERAFKRAMDEIEARQTAAAEAGDVEGVRAATREALELTAEVQKPKPEAKTEEPKGPPPEWLEENAWFETDRVMKAAAIEIAQELAERGLPTDRQLKEVAKRIREEFPHKFENPRRREAAAVEGGSARSAKSAKGWEDLPSEAKAAGDRFIRQGLIKDRATYAKNYHANA